MSQVQERGFTLFFWIGFNKQPNNVTRYILKKGQAPNEITPTIGLLPNNSNLFVKIYTSNQKTENIISKAVDNMFKDSTVISYIYMDEWDPDKYAMYPVVTYDSLQKYNKYKEFLQNKYPNVLFGGRAGVYRPLNMSQTIELAMGLAEQINKQ